MVRRGRDTSGVAYILGCAGVCHLRCCGHGWVGRCLGGGDRRVTGDVVSGLCLGHFQALGYGKGGGRAGGLAMGAGSRFFRLGRVCCIGGCVCFAVAGGKLPCIWLLGVIAGLGVFMVRAGAILCASLGLLRVLCFGGVHIVTWLSAVVSRLNGGLVVAHGISDGIRIGASRLTNRYLSFALIIVGVGPTTGLPINLQPRGLEIVQVAKKAASSPSNPGVCPGVEEGQSK